MKVRIEGVGAWGPGFSDWPELKRRLTGAPRAEGQAPTPKPAVIPANERRRAPLPARLAVQVSSEATAAAAVRPDQLSCVFSSGLGDTDLTHYMCEELAGPDKKLSPTKFHNSVHNAAGGYWTIATGCERMANSVAGMTHSVSMTLLESLTLCLCEQTPVLLACYDTPTNPVLQPLFPNAESFAAALVLSPERRPLSNTSSAAILEAQVLTERTDEWPELALPADLADLYLHNPAARMLCVLVALQQPGVSSLRLPLSPESNLALRIEV